MCINNVLDDTFSQLEAGKVHSNHAYFAGKRPILVQVTCSTHFEQENQCSQNVPSVLMQMQTRPPSTPSGLALILLLFHLQFSKHVSVNFIADPVSSSTQGTRFDIVFLFTAALSDFSTMGTDPPFLFWEWLFGSGAFRPLTFFHLLCVQWAARRDRMQCSSNDSSF